MACSKSQQKVERAELEEGRRMVRAVWGSGDEALFPYLWLRDNCQCAQCFFPHNKARTCLLNEVNLDIKAVSAEVRGDDVIVTWDDGHEGVFPGTWLRERRFTEEARQLRRRQHQRALQTWTTPLTPPTVTFNEILESDEALYRWILGLEEVGLVIITGAPQETGQLNRIAERVCGYLRHTLFGESFFVRSKESPSSVAYSTQRIPLHVDYVFQNDLPGMQLLHCIKQTPSVGGDNQLVDGFRAAEQLRAADPAAFNLLTSTPLDFFLEGTDAGREFFSLSKHPAIELDAAGNLKQINYSTHSRDSFVDVELEQVEPLYRALVQFTRLLYAPDNTVLYKMNDGDILTMNNRRVLHGRSSYTATADGDRVLEGSYIDWDELHSCRRVLARTLNIPVEQY